MRQKCGGFAAQRIICWPSLPHVQDVPPRQPDGLVLRYLQRHHGSRVTCRLAQCDSNQIQWSGKGYTRQYTGHHQPERPKPRCTHTCDNLVLALLVLVVAERGGGGHHHAAMSSSLPFPSSPHPGAGFPNSHCLSQTRVTPALLQAGDRERGHGPPSQDEAYYTSLCTFKNENKRRVRNEP